MLGHLEPGRARGGGRLVREQRRLPESLDLADVQAFLSGLRTHRDRAMVLAMLLSGLCSAEVRGLLLSSVDQGRRRLRVIGKGGRERVVPVDGAFFADSAPTCAGWPHRSASWCCAGPILERGSAKLGCGHCGVGTGKPRRDPGQTPSAAAPNGPEVAAGGIDLLALRELMDTQPGNDHSRRQSRLQQEADLTAGHGVLRATGFVAVSASDPDELECAVAAIEEAAISGFA